MKKLLSILFVLTIVACGGSDDEIVENDPVIGTWSGFETEDILFLQSDNTEIYYTYTIKITYNFNQNGTGSGSTIQNLDAPIDVINSINEVQQQNDQPNIGELFTIDFNWNNSNSNSDFSNTRQTYNFIFPEDSGELEFIFNVFFKYHFSRCCLNTYIYIHYFTSNCFKV